MNKPKNNEIKNSQDPKKKLEWKNLSFIYKPILEKLKKSDVTFTCSKCSSILFTNYEVTGIYIISLESHAFIVDPLKFSKILNLKKEDEIFNEDSKLRQKDCLFYRGLCIDCKTLIGHFIFCCPFEKDYMLDKILVFENKVDILITEGQDCYYIKLKDMIEDINEELKAELNEMNDLAKETNKKFTEIHGNLEKAEEYVEIKNIIIGTEQYLEDIEKLADYALYLEET
jgi:hypothetical protein